MIFNNINDENGTPLSVFAKLLQEKAAAAGLQCVFIFAAKDGQNKGLHVMSTIAAPVPVVLARLAQEMANQPPDAVTTEGPPVVH